MQRNKDRPVVVDKIMQSFAFHFLNLHLVV